MYSRSPGLLTVAGLLLLLSAILRLSEIVVQDPQGDEIHWNNRSDVFLAAVSSGNWHRATSHLGHPGIPAVMAMAVGKALNKGLPAPWEVDTLGAARAGNAAFSSVLAPTSFLVLSFCLGTPLALSLALFLAFDIQLIAVARMAHIDSSLAVLVTLCVAAYYHGTRQRSPGWKILAGILWGLCLASKPTALALIPAFLCFNTYKTLGLNFSLKSFKDIRPLDNHDIWAVLCGLLTLATVFTRFWEHNGPFLTSFGVESSLADAVYQTGMVLHGHLYLVLVTAGSLIFLCWRTCRKHGHRSTDICLANLSITGLLLAGTLALFPAVFENYVRYALRFLYLVPFIHEPSGFNWNGFSFGYFGVIAFQIPSTLLIICLAGLATFVWDFITRDPRLSPAVRDFGALAGLVFAIWLMVLNISAKQFVRYIIPVLPCLYFFGAYGLFVIQQSLRSRVASVARYLPLLLMMICAYYAWQTHPHYLDFYNSFFGGYREAYRLNYPLFYRGNIEALTFLREKLKEEPGQKTLAVAADLPVVAYTFHNHAPSEKFVLVGEPFVQNADYVFVNRPSVTFLSEERGFSFTGLRELYSSYSHGLPVVSIYEVISNDFKEPANFTLFALDSETGGTTMEDPALHWTGRTMLYAFPDRHDPGALFSGGYLKINPGHFRVTLSAILPASRMNSLLDASDTVLSFSLSSNCKIDIYAEVTNVKTLREYSGECFFPEPTRAEIRGYWHGQTPLIVDQLKISRLE